MWTVLGRDPSSVCLILLVGIAAGLLRGFTGFGSALLIVPALSLTLGPTSAVAIGTLLEGLASLLLVPAALKVADRRLMLFMSPAAAVAVPLGHTLLVYLDPTISNLAISGIVTVMAVLVFSGCGPPFPRDVRGHIGAGLFSGFLTGFGGVGGPPLVLYILTLDGVSAVKRASIIVVSALALIVAFASLAFHGLLTSGALTGATVLAPAFFLSIVIGARLFHIAGERFFQGVAISALLLAAIGLFVTNLMRALV